MLIRRSLFLIFPWVVPSGRIEIRVCRISYRELFLGLLQGDVWNFYMNASIFGLEIPTRQGPRSSTSAIYIPLLSGCRIFLPAGMEVCFLFECKSHFYLPLYAWWDLMVHCSCRYAMKLWLKWCRTMLTRPLARSVFTQCLSTSKEVMRSCGSPFVRHCRKS